jgi:outer membrane protein
MKILKTGLMALLLTFSVQSFATNLKIGVVDFREIVATSPQAKEIGEKLKQEFKAREEAMINSEKSLKDKSEKLQRNAAIMSEAEKNKLEREVVAGQRDLQRLQYEFREDTSLRQREEMQKFMEKIQVVIRELAQDQKYDLIIQSEVMPYVGKNIDVTDQVLKKLAKG